MKKSISFILLVCLLMIYVLPVNAETHPYSFNEATVITESSFSQLFNTDHIDQVTYNYQFNILQEHASQAHVILEISLKINNCVYDILTEGTVDSYRLNNGDILWEGPLDSNVSINGELYSVIAGFNLLDSTQESMISLTIQNNSTLVAISFGTNIITGSVLDFFMSQSINGQNNTNSTTVETHFDSFTPEDSYSTNVFGPGFSPITHPDDGGGSLNLGPNGEWEYQSLLATNHGTSSYKALKSGVYFDDTRNILMVTLTPFSTEAVDYGNSLGYDCIGGYLKKFGVKLTLEDAPAQSYAHISQIHKPVQTSYIDNYFNNAIVSLWPLFSDILGMLDVPTDTISAVLENTLGCIDAEDSELYAYIDIQNSLALDYSILDDIASGMPFRFILMKNNDDAYVGNTHYTVNTYAKYCVSVRIETSSTPVYCPIYFEESITHEGTVTLS